MVIQKNLIGLHEKALLENQRADEANFLERKNAADIDYIAMMCDVDLDDGEESMMSEGAGEEEDE